MEELIVFLPVIIGIINGLMFAIERHSHHRKNMVMIEAYKKYPEEPFKKIVIPRKNKKQ